MMIAQVIPPSIETVNAATRLGQKILQKVNDANYKMNNLSVSIEAAKPKLEQHIPEIKKSLKTRHFGPGMSAVEPLTS